MVGIVVVLKEYGDHAGRGSAEKRFLRFYPLQRGLEVLEVLTQRLFILICNWSRTDWTLHTVRAQGTARILWELEQIRRANRSCLAGKASQTVFHISRVADLPSLSVIDDVYSALDLLAHDLRGRGPHPPLKGGLIL